MFYRQVRTKGGALEVKDDLSPLLYKFLDPLHGGGGTSVTAISENASVCITSQWFN